MTIYLVRMIDQEREERARSFLSLVEAEAVWRKAMEEGARFAEIERRPDGEIIAQYWNKDHWPCGVEV